MHDPTRSAASLAPQNAPNGSPSRRHKLFSVLPEKAPSVLAKDTVSIENPALAWPHRSLETRRIFQDLFCRYYRQILYGCKNATCQTPTCLSHQKKSSKRPFRRFTTLSARSLAAFLASQDSPEKGLCPHEPVDLLEEPEVNLLQKENNKPSVCWRRNLTPTAYEQQAAIKNTQSSGSLSSGNRNSHIECQPRHNDGNVNIIKPKDGESSSRVYLLPKHMQNERKHVQNARLEKDAKSFVQNLFDTVALKTLHIARIPEGYLQWVPWLQVPNDNLLSRDTQSSDQSDLKTVGAAERENLLGQAKSSPCVNKSKLGLEVDKSPILKSTRRSFEIKSARLNAKSARPYSGILENDDGFGSKKFKNQARKQNQDEDTQGLSLKSLQITSEPAADSRASEATIDIKSTPLFMPDQVIDGNCLTIPTFSSGNSIAPPQALGRFTLENIVALVDTVKMAHLTLHDDHQLFDRLGRTTTPFRASSFVDGSARSREKSVAFGKQSIISILSCPSSLLKSFVTLTADGTIDSRNYAGYLEIVEAFRSLGKIDHHPKSVFPSLCTSTRKIHKPQNLRLRNQNIKICKAIESDFGSPIRDHALDTYDDGVLDDVEAAHIVKIILAALAASVPESDLDVWYHYRTLRTLGRSAPRPKTVRDDKILTNSLLALMDSFEDEMALGLMTRLVKAITARCCVSKMSRYQEAGANEENLGALGSNFMYCILRDILVDGVEDRYIMMPLQFNDAWLDTHFDYLQNVRFIRATCMVEYERDDPSLRITIIVEWLRSVILKEWDGKAEVSRWGAVGSALEFMSCLFHISKPLEIEPAVFYILILSERLDIMNMPTDWLSSPRDRNTVHLLSYPFIFIPPTLVSYYRAINHAAMFKAFEGSMVAARLEAQMQMTFVDPVTGRGELRLHDRLKIATSNYLVLVIRRENVLTDALNQLWRRERRELMKPLKVRMGMEEGEEGVDHGGVQQEFFRVAMSEFMRLDYGLFTIDPQTQMLWFQPGALEPLHKFELLGLLTSLAVYNGLTLPVTFPLALYRKLLDLPVTKLEHIEDGWPSLMRGLKSLLNYEDDSGRTRVEDVFMRSYIFSVETLGTTISVDMEKIGREDDWHSVQGSKLVCERAVPQSRSESKAEMLSSMSKNDLNVFQSSADGSDGLDLQETLNGMSSTPGIRKALRTRTDSITSQARMVTELNRNQYVEDYIFWLTDKSIRPQYEAFARGFYVCLDRKATTILSPELLKRMVEGTQEIDVDALQEGARYEGGYSSEHPVIKDFWHVVHELPEESVRRLLEFVTASDRIPVNGIRNIQFIIQRNGNDDHRLPTSLTCFGRLLLPAYSSRNNLREKLCIAIENSQGFGVA